MASKKKGKSKLYFVLDNGARYEVTGEDGKYVYCGATQFRRARGEIVTETVAVQEAPEEKTAEE